MRRSIVIYISLLFCFLFTKTTKAQNIKDCKHPCEKTRTVKYGAFIGVKIVDILNAKYVLVQDVVPNTAAFTFGIQANDVITHINGIEMQHTAHLLSEIAKLQPGQEVQVNILRQGTSKEFNFPLGAQFSKTISIIECCDSISDQMLEIALSPIPAKEFLYINMNDKINGEIQLYLLNPNGEILFSKRKMSNGEKFKDQIDIRTFKSGTYFLKIVIDKQHYLKRFTKE